MADKDGPDDKEQPQRDANGRFLPGNQVGKGFGRIKGSRNKLTMKLLERFEMRNQDGISIEELMFDIAQGEEYDMELRLKAADKLASLVFPKTAQVELDVEDGATTSVAEMDERINQILQTMNDEEKKEE